jgi:hypothetical protein
MQPQVMMLDKLARNLNNIGVVAVRAGDTVVADGLTISLVNASIQAPMGGVDPANSPFLGIGVAAPKIFKIKGGAGENTVAAIVADAAAVKIVAFVAHFANDIVIEAGDTTTELVRIPGHADVFGLGQ